MKAQKLYDILQTNKLIPIVSGSNSDLAVKIVELLISASLPLTEITLRDNNSIKTIEIIKNKYPNIIIGAGTIINLSDAKKAISAGADFLVSPGLDDQIAKYAASQPIPYIPGVATSTEIQHAYQLGITVLKWFPALFLGGPKTLTAIDGPFGHYGIKFIPTGGINSETFVDYLILKNVLAVGGSFMIPDKTILEQDRSTALSFIKKIVKLSRST